MNKRTIALCLLSIGGLSAQVENATQVMNSSHGTAPSVSDMVPAVAAAEQAQIVAQVPVVEPVGAAAVIPTEPQTPVVVEAAVVTTTPAESKEVAAEIEKISIDAKALSMAVTWLEALNNAIGVRVEADVIAMIPEGPLHTSKTDAMTTRDAIIEWFKNIASDDKKASMEAAIKKITETKKPETAPAKEEMAKVEASAAATTAEKPVEASVVTQPVIVGAPAPAPSPEAAPIATPPAQ